MAHFVDLGMLECSTLQLLPDLICSKLVVAGTSDAKDESWNELNMLSGDERWSVSAIRCVSHLLLQLLPRSSSHEEHSLILGKWLDNLLKVISGEWYVAVVEESGVWWHCDFTLTGFSPSLFLLKAMLDSQLPFVSWNLLAIDAITLQSPAVNSRLLASSCRFFCCCRYKPSQQW